MGALSGSSSEGMVHFPGRAVGANALNVLRGASLFMVLSFTIVLIYTCVTDGSPFRLSLLTPWMNATLVDFYWNVAALSLIVVLREKSILCAIAWIVVLCCLGSGATWFYVWMIAMRARPSDTYAKLALGSSAPF